MWFLIIISMLNNSNGCCCCWWWCLYQQKSATTMFFSSFRFFSSLVFSFLFCCNDDLSSHCCLNVWKTVACEMSNRANLIFWTVSAVGALNRHLPYDLYLFSSDSHCSIGYWIKFTYLVFTGVFFFWNKLNKIKLNAQLWTNTTTSIWVLSEAVRANERTQIMASIRWTSPVKTRFEINALFCHRMWVRVSQLLRYNHFAVSLMFNVHSRDKFYRFFLLFI